MVGMRLNQIPTIGLRFARYVGRTYRVCHLSAKNALCLSSLPEMARVASLRCTNSLVHIDRELLWGNLFQEQLTEVGEHCLGGLRQ